MSKRGGLGRGLSALIPGAEVAEEGTGFLEVPVNSIAPNPKQPRTHFDDEALAGLAASIREVGILQPLVVRRTVEGRYELIAGYGASAPPGQRDSRWFPSCSVTPVTTRSCGMR